METIHFEKLLLKTAFCCMACDGDIDKEEVNLIRSLHKNQNTFKDVEIEQELDNLLLEINKNSSLFLQNYFSELSASNLSVEEELKLIEIAIETIKADKKIEYSEIKFFKIIRTKLQIDNDSILEKHPDFEEYLEQDIINEFSFLKLENDFLTSHALPEFSLDILRKLEN